MMLSRPAESNNRHKTFSPKKAVFGAVLGVVIFAQITILITPSLTQAQNINRNILQSPSLKQPVWQTFNLNGIKLNFDSFTNNKPGNYLRVGLDGSLKIGGKITIASLQKCTANDDSCLDPKNWQKTDKIDLSKDQLFFSNNANGRIDYFGIGVKSKENIGNYTCFQDARWATTYKDSDTYMNCRFPEGASQLGKEQTTIVAGQTEPGNIAFQKQWEITGQINFANLGLMGPSGNEKSKRQSLYVYPFIERTGWRQSWIVFKPGKEVIVDVYKTQAEADADTSQPEGVPSYGAVTAVAESKAPLSGIPKLIADIFVSISQLFIDLTYRLFANLVAPMLEGILSIRVYTDAFVNVIYSGWEVLRNVVNIYFIVAVIAIAMGTLFRVESYKFRHLLVQLIIAALVVNFSLVISQAVLGVADTVQNQFLPNNAQVIRELGKDLMPNRILEIINSSQFAQGSFFATASMSLFFMALAIGSFLVFCGILAFLVIRIVMLWILLMVSPLAYAAGVLPSTANLRSKWWGEFLKYAFFTPIMAFFMNMAAIIAVNYEFVFRDIAASAAFAQLGGFATLVLSVASNVLLLVFLIASLKIAEQFGIYGADKITEIAKKGMFMPFKVAAVPVVGGAKLAGKGGKALVGFGLEKIHEKTGWELRPTAWIEGWKHSREENRAKRKILGQARAEEKGLPFGNPTSFFQRYWHPHTIKRLLKGGDKRGRKVFEEAEKIKADYLARKGSMNEDERRKLMGEYRKKLHLAHQLMAPVDYHTQKEFRGKTDEEKGKIHTKNWHELFSLFEAAKHEHEPLRAAGIFKKVTETYNENEFINSSVYHRDMLAGESAEWTDPKTKAALEARGITKDSVLHKKGSHFVFSRKGADNFRKMVLQEELGLGEQASMQLMNDISDTAEDTNHRVIMRMYGERAGKLYLKTDDEAEPEVRGENNKLNAERMINLCNRLAGFIEIPSDDYEITGERYSQITAPMLAYYIEHPSDIEPLVRRGRINSSQAKSFSENYEEILHAGAVILDKDHGPKDQRDAANPQDENLYTRYELFEKAMKIMKEKGEALTVDAQGKSTIDKAMEAMPELVRQAEANRINRRPTS